MITENVQIFNNYYISIEFFVKTCHTEKCLGTILSYTRVDVVVPLVAVSVVMVILSVVVAGVVIIVVVVASIPQGILYAAPAQSLQPPQIPPMQKLLWKNSDHIWRFDKGTRFNA
jgi:hypothetical protein